MTDHEMLELAALAAGIDIHFDEDGDSYRVKASGNRVYWNPRDDDGDSRRLEVKLGIKVLPYPIFGHEKHSVIASRRWWASPEDDDNTYVGPEVMEAYGTNPCAATRLAVLRVAAEIGQERLKREVK